MARGRAAAARGRQPAAHRGDRARRRRTPPADVVVAGRYEVGMQDQAFLGPESGLAIPDGEGGVDLHIATQWLHVDRDQVAASLGLAPEQVRLVLGGVGGAFGGREDLSMQIHACLLALRTGRPVKMVYSREESFVGHVHRHPCTDGVRARRRRATGGSSTYAPGSCSTAARTRRARPRSARTRRASPPGRTRCPTRASPRTSSTRTTRRAARCAASAPSRSRSPTRRRWTGSPPSWAWTRSRCALRNAIAPGDRAADRPGPAEPAPVAELLERVGALPLPARARRARPARAAGRRRQHDARRGRAARRRLRASGSRTSASPRASTTTRPRACASRVDADGPLVEVHTAAVEVGQGVQTIQAQIARTELGVERVDVLPRRHGGRLGRLDVGLAPDLRDRRRGQGRVRGGARAARGARRGRSAASPRSPRAPVEATVEWHHRPTHPLDERGQGDAHLQFAFSVHRAVVDVDCELGLVRVVELATAAGGRARHEPAGARGPDRGRLRPGARARADGGDRRCATARS